MSCVCVCVCVCWGGGWLGVGVGVVCVCMLKVRRQETCLSPFGPYNLINQFLVHGNL